MIDTDPLCKEINYFLALCTTGGEAQEQILNSTSPPSFYWSILPNATFGLKIVSYYLF